ncbi:MAG TPA: hypothetical protein ENF17_06410 [Candidatus Aminicenantes bacterium]|nr:hypothetical protein [Candidatus Aminicenantes bacterium]
MIHLLFGLTFGALLAWFIFFLRQRQLRLKWWQRVLGVILAVYILFVVELVISFLEEGALRGALVIGVIFGFVGLVGGVLVWRWFISSSKKSLRVAAKSKFSEFRSLSPEPSESLDKGEKT